jgi:antitoxin MazE
MQTVVKKWGNSLAVRVPQSIATAADLQEGTAVNLTLEAGALVVKLARPRYTLEELLEGYKPEHRHAEVGWGPPRGDEAW